MVLKWKWDRWRHEAIFIQQTDVTESATDVAANAVTDAVIDAAAEAADAAVDAGTNFLEVTTSTVVS